MTVVAPWQRRWSGSDPLRILAFIAVALITG